MTCGTITAMPTPPCAATRWQTSTTFIDPDSAPQRHIEAALATCQSCALRRQCAADALTAGRPLNNDRATGEHSTVARGVIMAGVVCDGSAQAEAALRHIAGDLAPAVTITRRRDVTGLPCRNCGAPLFKWTRQPWRIPAGFAMHHGRQFCVQCRVAYNQAAAAERTPHREYTGKAVDRRRHHSATIGQRVRTAHQQGSVPVALAAEAAEHIATAAARLSVERAYSTECAARHIAEDTARSMALLGLRGWADAHRTTSVVVTAALNAA